MFCLPKTAWPPTYFPIRLRLGRCGQRGQFLVGRVGIWSGELTLIFFCVAFD